MNNAFKSVGRRRLKRSNFDLSRERKLSFHMGNLVPVFVQEVLPSDTFKVSTETLIRLAPLLAPVMHRVNVYIHYFFVPNRIIWPQFTDFITGNVDLLVPQLTLDDNTGAKGTLADYFGLPIVPSGKTMTVNALPFMAYNKIFNEFYRDENLVGEVAPTQQYVLKRAWEKDYFTSALPWTQKGGEAELPIHGEFSPSYRSDPYINTPNGPVDNEFLGTVSRNGSSKVGNISVGDSIQEEFDSAASGALVNLTSSQSVESSVTINALRMAEKLQRWLERNARAGSRYVEHLLAHWNVVSSDARLQRPEYLGGGKQAVTISEVLSTAAAQDSEGYPLPQANMAGSGYSVGSTNKFKKFFEEHGYVIGIMSVLPRSTYQQGIPKHFLRSDKLDFYFPEFAHLGEQEVLNKEIYFDPSDNKDDEVFGYQSRYAEYRFAPSLVSGDFRDSLSYWHLGRKFSNRPLLNEDFVKFSYDKRIFAVNDSQVDEFYAELYHNVQAVRPIPRYGIPSL